MLLPAEVDSVLEEGGRKRNSVWPGGPADDKMVLTLLVEVVAFHVGPTAVDIRGLGLKFVSRSTFQVLEECLDDSIQVLLALAISARILGNEKRGSLRGSGRSFRRSRRSFGISKSLGGAWFV